MGLVQNLYCLKFQTQKISDPLDNLDIRVQIHWRTKRLQDIPCFGSRKKAVQLKTINLISDICLAIGDDFLCQAIA